jgi:hypothetical protein
LINGKEKRQQKQTNSYIIDKKLSDERYAHVCLVYVWLHSGFNQNWFVSYQMWFQLKNKTCDRFCDFNYKKKKQNKIVVFAFDSKI